MRRDGVRKRLLRGHEWAGADPQNVQLPAADVWAQMYRDDGMFRSAALTVPEAKVVCTQIAGCRRRDSNPRFAVPADHRASGIECHGPQRIVMLEATCQ
jgi:hypothetical protein